MSLSIVIPAKNEGGAIAAVVANACAEYPDAEVIVVDDGSDDDTAKVAAAAGARVVSHPESLGNGAAVKSGARAATGDIIAFMDYRNLEEKKDGEEQTEEVDPTYDEYGREVIKRQVFDNVQELEQVPGAERLPPDGKAEMLRLVTTQSQVFSIFVTARIVTGNQNGRDRMLDGPPRPGERDDELGNALTRTVRAVVWRVTGDDGTTILPLVRWEVLDYSPFEVLDYPDDDR
jgi:glycosyltransferase involved in cell wall biosynthesis